MDIGVIIVWSAQYIDILYAINILFLLYRQLQHSFLAGDIGATPYSG